MDYKLSEAKRKIDELFQALGDEEINSSPSEDPAFNEMLMAWYYSGYATGRYHAFLEMQNRPLRDECNQEAHGSEDNSLKETNGPKY